MLPSYRTTRLLLVAALFSVGLGSIAVAVQLNLETATIPELNAAFKSGALTSESLTERYLARLKAYDQDGPKLNAVITLNPKALEEAKALDAERKAEGPRSPIHGVPIILKDNFDTFDLPTTAGSQLLKGSIPPDDAFVVKKLRDAGAVIIAKMNLSEFAGGGGGGGPGGFSSMGLQTHNPHDLSKSPGGSSGGTGAGIAAVYAQFGLGTDTGGSIRQPSSFNGIVGLKPTHGLMSRDGIVPLTLSFDTGGPMARNVTDVAIALGLMTGVDPADAATKKSAGKFAKDYTKFLKVGSLKGARIGIARDFFRQNPETDRIVEDAIVKLKALGATIVDPVNYPDYFLKAKQAIYQAISPAEFKAQIAVYLATTKPGYPRSLADLAAKAADPATGYTSPWKRDGLKKTLETAPDLTSPVYLAAKNEGLALAQAVVTGTFTKHKLDALIYPTWPVPALKIDPNAGSGTDVLYATNIANLTGFPDLIVPAGVTKDGLPVTISFLGLAFTEGKLLSYGYDFEQATHARVLPKTTPALPTDTVTY